MVFLNANRRGDKADSTPATTTTKRSSHMFIVPSSPPAPLPPSLLAARKPKMLLLPSMLFSLTGGGYAHAVSPAYGKAWAMASSLWLLFLLLVALRLDGERGDARPAFGQMRWLGVYFPLWVFLLILIAAHEALPYVWDVDVFRVPAPPPPPPLEGEGGGDNAGGRVRGVLSRLAGRLAWAIAARRERAQERAAAAAAAAAASDAADAANAADDAGAGGTDAGDRAVGDEAAPVVAP